MNCVYYIMCYTVYVLQGKGVTLEMCNPEIIHQKCLHQASDILEHFCVTPELWRLLHQVCLHYSCVILCVYSTHVGHGQFLHQICVTLEVFTPDTLHH